MLVGVAKTCRDGELSKLLNLVQNKSPTKGSVHFYQAENTLIVTLPLLCLNVINNEAESASLDVNANIRITKNLEDDNVSNSSVVASSSRTTASKTTLETENESPSPGSTEPSTKKEEGSTDHLNHNSTNLSSRLSANLR